MKFKNLWVGSVALGLALTGAQLAPALHAQSQSEPPSAQQQPNEHKSETFVGQVVKARNGQYALLMDKQSGKGFYLDDQDKAKAFDGKNVKVTGTLDIARNMIHVTDIQAA